MVSNRMLSFLTAVLAFFIAGTGAAVAQTGYHDGRAAMKKAVHNDTALTVRETVDEVNRVRRRHGLPPLHFEQRLSSAAQRFSQELARQGKLSHCSRRAGCLPDRLNRVQYDYLAAGETLGAGYQSPRDVVEAWMDSPGHRGQLLSDKVSQVGVGYSYDPNRLGGTWTMIVAAPR